ncbi:MAG: restriction endonuclease [Acidobacteria bacterium]|nr:restriction endonuclease [Acidobacteriota bacterium]
MSKPGEGQLRLPNFNEFTRGVLGSLAAVLEVVSKSEGDRERLQRKIADAFPNIKNTPPAQRLNRANNVLIGMDQCGLFDLKTSRLTDLGRTLLAVPDDAQRHRDFARHLLQNHHGLELLLAARAIQDRRDQVSKKSIRDEMRRRGFFLTTNAVDPGKMRQWLEAAGVIDDAWKINETQVTALTGGVSPGVLEQWRSLTRPQRALVATMRRLTPPEVEQEAPWLDGGHVRKLCETNHGHGTLPEDSLRREVIDHLVEADWVESEGTGRGRGGKIGRLRLTSTAMRITAELPVELPSGIPAEIPPTIRRKMNQPIGEIWDELFSKNTTVKGLALEVLAARLAQDLGLRPVRFRERSRATGGAEVDLIADGLHLHYSRWLFQCKNTPSSPVALAALAKEVGMAMLLKAHVIVLVSTGRFARTVREHANRLAEGTPLQAVLIDRSVLDDYRNGGGSRLVDFFADRAGETLIAKQPQLRATQDSDTDS